MVGICKLCEQSGELRESHFIPKFIGKWIRKTSITGFIREKNEPKKRAQDIAKEYWLCDGCEGMLSNWEAKFANTIFYPFLEGNESVASYGEWMSRFCASLSWRTLTFIQFKNYQKVNTQNYYDMLAKTEKHLADYLLGKTNNLNEYEQHLYPLDKIESTKYPNPPANINRYFLRTMAMDIVGNGQDYFIYTKLPSFIILGIIQCKQSKKMRSSRIALKSGIISPRCYVMPDGFHAYLIGKAQEIDLIYNSIPESHRDKIEEYWVKNPDKVLNSKQYEAFIYDYSMFGDDVFRQ